MNNINEVLNYTVFPSEDKTISVELEDTYGGAHDYIIRESIGFENGEAVYVNTYQEISFIKKLDNGEVVPGLQSEQLIYVLLDRVNKLNNRFPSEYNKKMIEGLEMFLDACKERIKDRIDRGVMGKLKK